MVCYRCIFLYAESLVFKNHTRIINRSTQTMQTICKSLVCFRCNFFYADMILIPHMQNTWRSSLWTVSHPVFYINGHKPNIWLLFYQCWIFAWILRYAKCFMIPQAQRVHGQLQMYNWSFSQMVVAFIAFKCHCQDQTKHQIDVSNSDSIWSEQELTESSCPLTWLSGIRGARLRPLEFGRVEWSLIITLLEE